MKIHVMEVDEVALEPIFKFFEIDEKLSGKKLLWQADELFIGEPDIEDYDPVRFDKIKDISSGAAGIGRFGEGRSKLAIVAASYGNISHFEDLFDEIIDEWSKESSDEDDYPDERETILKLYERIK